MAAADAYEERPLIWRAKLLLDGGDVEAAAARSPARPSPSTPPTASSPPATGCGCTPCSPTRWPAQGEDDDAELYRGVVRAIRASEDADLLYDAGFLALSIRGYEASLLDFSDAYCIQSRLAVRLMEAGRVDEAAEHYRRAFELMPDSFGRVESHCFGCEGAFRGPVAQGVAERVFERLARERPDDAQVPYLVGYLAEERGDLEAARAGYRAAVDLDPLYLNAWKNLFELGERMRLPDGEEDEALLALLRLDPLGRHARGDTDRAQRPGGALGCAGASGGGRRRTGAGRPRLPAAGLGRGARRARRPRSRLVLALAPHRSGRPRRGHRRAPDRTAHRPAGGAAGLRNRSAAAAWKPSDPPGRCRTRPQICVPGAAGSRRDPDPGSRPRVIVRTGGGGRDPACVADRLFQASSPPSITFGCDGPMVSTGRSAASRSSVCF